MGFQGTRDFSRTVDSYAKSDVQKWFSEHRKLHSWRVRSVTNCSWCIIVIVFVS